MTVVDVVRLLHTVGAVLFVGGLLSAAIWQRFGSRDPGPQSAVHLSRSLLRADVLMVAPGLLLLLITGVALTVAGRFDIRAELWLLLSLILFVSAAAMWIFYLLPKERELIEIARRSLATGKLDPAYRNASNAWAMASVVLTFLGVVVLALMVLKPF